MSVRIFVRIAEWPNLGGGNFCSDHFWQENTILPKKKWFGFPNHNILLKDRIYVSLFTWLISSYMFLYCIHKISSFYFNSGIFMTLSRIWKPYIIFKSTLKILRQTKYIWMFLLSTQACPWREQMYVGVWHSHSRIFIIWKYWEVVSILNVFALNVHMPGCS